MKCSATTRSGKSCRRNALIEPDPDGHCRCPIHTTSEDGKARRAAAYAKAAEAGRAGKRRHVETAKAVQAAQRAAGVVVKTSGKRGMDPLPLGVKVPAAGEALVIPFNGSLGAQASEEPLVAKRTRLTGYDLQTAAGRNEMLQAVICARDAGQIDSKEAEVYLRAIKTADGMKADTGSRRTVQVRFKTILTRDQADAYKRAQEIKGGAA